MKQHELAPKKGSKKSHRRRGIGDSFAGKGVKGQQKRVGGRKKFSAAFEGGQISLVRRMPKLGGFRNPNRVEFQTVNLRELENFAGEKVDAETLKAAGMISKIAQPIKILGFGKLTKKLNINVDAASESAKKAIEAAGGKITVAEKKEKATKKAEAAVK